MSSAYLNNLFIRKIVRRSDALMTYETGPILEPWTIDAFMTRKPEIMSMTLVQCRRLEKYSKSISRPKGWLQFRNMFRKQNNKTFIELPCFDGRFGGIVNGKVEEVENRDGSKGS